MLGEYFSHVKGLEKEKDKLYAALKEVAALLESEPAASRDREVSGS